MMVFLGCEDLIRKGGRTVALVRLQVRSSGYVAMSTPLAQTKAMAASLMGSYRERWDTKKRGMGGPGGGIRVELTFT